MKKVVSLLLIVCMMFAFSSCTQFASTGVTLDSFTSNVVHVSPYDSDLISTIDEAEEIINKVVGGIENDPTINITKTKDGHKGVYKRYHSEFTVTANLSKNVTKIVCVLPFEAEEVLERFNNATGRTMVNSYKGNIPIRELYAYIHIYNCLYIYNVCTNTPRPSGDMDLIAQIDDMLAMRNSSKTVNNWQMTWTTLSNSIVFEATYIG